LSGQDWDLYANPPDIRREVRLWDLHTNQNLGFFAQMNITLREMLTATIFCVAITPNGQIVLRSKRDTLSLHDPRAQDPHTTLKEISLDVDINSLDLSPDGQELAIGGSDKVYLWNFQSDKPCIELKGHSSVYCVAYSPCGNWILAGCYYEEFRIWRFRAGEVSSWSCVSVVGGCSDTIMSVAWNPVVALEFVTGCEDGSVRVWRITSHDDADGGDVSVQMLWGNDLGLLSVSDLSFEGAIGLSPINQKLLVQRTRRDIFRLEEDKLGEEDVEEYWLTSEDVQELDASEVDDLFDLA
ncbi:hypothetical protein BGZ91_011920, partial [Linnemannia elongata]